MKDLILKCTGIICITIALVSAHQQGFNGTITSVVVALIGGISGYEIAKAKIKNKSK